MGSNHPGLNENYFEQIDTKEKAYWLGFLYADGCVKPKRQIMLCLSIKDKEQVEKFCNAVSANKDQIKIRKHAIKSIGKTYYSANIFICSDKMFNDLSLHGCGPNKTMRLALPSLNSEELYKAFLLGYYDGDGTSASSVISSGCLPFLLEVKSKFNIIYDPKLKRNPYGHCYNLSMGWKLKNEIMTNFEDSMKRKRKITNGTFRFAKGNKYSPKGRPCFRQAKPLNISVPRDQLQKMVIEKSILTVCKELDVSYNRLNRYLKENHFIIPSAQQKSIAHRKFNVTKEELENLIVSTPMTTIGKMFGVSDNAIRKRARFFGIL